MALRNRFGWSISREAMFDACPRSYYFHYYLSWGGWEKNAPPLRRETFRLKRLTSLPLWRGQLVHYITTKVLASMRSKGRIPRTGDVIAYVEERFEKQFDFSRRKLYLSRPKKKGGRLDIDWLALFEHEYDRDIPPSKSEKTLEECREALRGLLGSDILEEISRTDTTSWVIENIDLAEFAQVFEFEGAQVFAKTDFIFRGENGTFDIVDWKTFAPRAPSGEKAAGEVPAGDGRAGVQLGVYGFYASSVLGEPVGTIRLHEVNLLAGGASVDYRIGEGDLELFRCHITAGVERLSSVLEGRDIGRNEPLGPDAFPKKVSPACPYCNFYRVCEDPGRTLGLD